MHFCILYPGQDKSLKHFTLVGIFINFFLIYAYRAQKKIQATILIKKKRLCKISDIVTFICLEYIKSTNGLIRLRI